MHSICDLICMNIMNILQANGEELREKNTRRTINMNRKVVEDLNC